MRLLTSRTTASERTALHQGLRDGQVDLVVGTHALLTDEVRFHSLGVVVIDEQHRFGVEQRAALRDKGRSSVLAEAAGPDGGADPDLLVMTATPIPRTAAMVVFGDLDMVVLDELPPGRTPVTTVWARTDLEETEAWERVRDEVAAGRRAYVVCPLVEGSDKVEATSAVAEYERLAAEDLAGLRVGLLHGQMPAADKEAAMAAFRAGELEVLVATTVIEVGVDVPEATVMVVEDAERFGIAQLHQLRGRVGRGADRSWCYLLGAAAEGDAAERLRALERTTDGFELAEVDLELRGEGTILGTRQKGRSDLQLASLRRDRDLLDAGPGGGRGDHRRRPAPGGPPAARGRDQALRRRGGGGLPLQELTGHPRDAVARRPPGGRRRPVGAAAVRCGRARDRRCAAGSAPEGPPPGRGAADLGPGPRGHLRHLGVDGRGGRPVGARPVLRERGPRGRGALAGGGPGDLRRPRRRRAGRGAATTWPRSAWPTSRPSWCGPSSRAGCARAPAVDLALCDPPYAFDDWTSC